MTFEKILSFLTGDLEPVHRLVRRLIEAEGYPTQADPDRFVLLPRPRLGPEAFAVSLYPPFRDDAISRYELIHRFQIPSKYREILFRLNGLDAFRFSLWGIFPSMAEDPPLLDRNRPGPRDLATANLYWINGYPLEEPLFHIGGNGTEEVGYFLRPDEHIVAYRKNGELVRSWKSFNSFLEEEISRAEAGFPEFEERMAKALTEYYASVNSKSAQKKPKNKPKNNLLG